MVIWLIGLSGAGKTSLGRALAKRWRQDEPNTVLLDGDELRALFAHDRGSAPYSVEGRRLNAERITALCELLDHQGIHVVCCILSIFPEMRAQNRQRFSRYYEVFLDAPLATLQARDSKGLYAAAAAGQQEQVVGIDIPFERPTHADLILDTSGSAPDLAELAETVLSRARAS